MRYMRYTAYVCMFGRRGKGAEISLMGVRFFEIAIPLILRPLIALAVLRALYADPGAAQVHFGRQNQVQSSA